MSFQKVVVVGLVGTLFTDLKCGQADPGRRESAGNAKRCGHPLYFTLEIQGLNGTAHVHARLAVQLAANLVVFEKREPLCQAQRVFGGSVFEAVQPCSI
jgi:hypothetical protein